MTRAQFSPQVATEHSLFEMHIEDRVPRHWTESSHKFLGLMLPRRCVGVEDISLFLRHPGAPG